VSGGELEFLRETLPEGVSAEREILVPEGTAIDELWAALEAVFAEDEQLEAVRVDDTKRLLGFTTRQAFLNSLAPSLKALPDFGASDHLELPGTADIHPLAFECPVDGQRFVVFFLDPGEVRTCPRHPGTALVMVTRP
jgi:hypothetical protein